MKKQKKSWEKDHITLKTFLKKKSEFIGKHLSIAGRLMSWFGMGWVKKISAEKDKIIIEYRNGIINRREILLENLSIRKRSKTNYELCDDGDTEKGNFGCYIHLTTEN